MTNSTSEIVYRELPGDDPTQRSPDISLAKELISWEPTIGIEEGLQKTIDYFKNFNK
jgi:nucleoside-diphosphate-sugar epimerase